MVTLFFVFLKYYYYISDCKFKLVTSEFLKNICKEILYRPCHEPTVTFKQIRYYILEIHNCVSIYEILTGETMEDRIMLLAICKTYVHELIDISWKLTGRDKCQKFDARMDQCWKSLQPIPFVYCSGLDGNMPTSGTAVW